MIMSGWELITAAQQSRWSCSLRVPLRVFRKSDRDGGPPWAPSAGWSTYSSARVACGDDVPRNTPPTASASWMPCWPDPNPTGMGAADRSDQGRSEGSPGRLGHR